MKGKLLKTFASSAVALSMLVGCSSGSGTAATELKEGDTVKIGLSIPLSEVHAICYRSPHNPLKKSIFFKS